jgi:hypothetical protein
VEIPRIYADFNGIGRSRRDPSRWAIPLDTMGSLKDLSNAGIRLREGVRLTVYSDSAENEDLEGDAVVFFDRESGVWIAELDEKGYRYVVVASERPAEFVFRCLGCREPLPPHPKASWAPVERCPRCGTPYTAAIAPPDAE